MPPFFCADVNLVPGWALHALANLARVRAFKLLIYNHYRRAHIAQVRNGINLFKLAKCQFNGSELPTEKLLEA